MPATKVSFALPAHSCDCHTHIFADPAKFPFAARRGYTPEPAGPSGMKAFHQALGIALSPHCQCHKRWVSQ